MLLTAFKIDAESFSLRSVLVEALRDGKSVVLGLQVAHAATRTKLLIKDPIKFHVVSHGLQFGVM